MPSMHGTRGSNSRHLVLETSALPTELVPYCAAKVNIYSETTTISPVFLYICSVLDLQITIYYGHKT